MGKRGGGLIPDSRASIKYRKVVIRKGNPSNFKDETGQRYGRLTVINTSPKRYNNEVVWICKCDCGQTLEVRGPSLRLKETRSCGCLHKDQLRERNRSNTNPRKQEIRAIAQQMRAQGMSCAQIAQLLTEQKLETLSGKPETKWHPSTISWLLKD